MFFIAGTGEEAMAVAQGEFNCPKCDQLRGYIQKRVSRYVSTFFIPVWRSSGGLEFVECQSCGSQFDNSVLVADFDRNSEIARLTNAAGESGSIAVNSKDPQIARSNYEIAVEAYSLALALRPESGLKEDIENALRTLRKWFPSSMCINEALGICDESNKLKSVTDQLELLHKARRLLECGLARRDAGYDGIMSIYDQIMTIIPQAEAMQKKEQGR